MSEWWTQYPLARPLDEAAGTWLNHAATAASKVGKYLAVVEAAERYKAKATLFYVHGEDCGCDPCDLCDDLGIAAHDAEVDLFQALTALDVTE